MLFLLFVYYDPAISIHYKFLCGHTAFISLGYKTKSGITGSCDVSNTFKEAVIFANEEDIDPLKKVVAC